MIDAARAHGLGESRIAGDLGIIGFAGFPPSRFLSWRQH